MNNFLNKKKSLVKGKKILVVDDDQDILDAIQFTLENEGYEVEISQQVDLIEDFISMRRSLPDLVILDVLLSGTHGKIICKKLKSHKATKNIPIIMISAQPGAMMEAKKSEANAFLPKPFDVRELLEVVQTQLK